ncbi:uncharacterized protein [Mycetomoellerius zeteki]|uniref:uncharacterized protein n=1 Tax=Mycetomoellerius zeteki TaxID=64791 RepID=UPI00084E46E2|nr:PREDICTED: uncharacterized protein LOC108731289 [Trachymyrmex zeteki]
MYEAHTQNQQKVNVWAGILNEAIIVPFFIEDNLNADNYLTMFQDEIIPFQQNGTSPHYSLQVRQYLNEVFSNRWIGRRGYIEWPARSPDLDPLDYFL